MRLFQLSSAVSLALLAAHTPVSAASGPWAGSYAANGTCYCTGNLDPSLQQKIVSTPTGDRSVLQICARIGAGPQLESTDGVYNYPVFRDPQCGHGPFPIGDEVADASCAGSLNPDSGDCQPVGPTWNFEAAVASTVIAEPEPELEPLPPIAETVELAESSNVTALNNTVDVSRPHHIKPPVGITSSTDEDPADIATVVESVPVAPPSDNSEVGIIRAGVVQDSVQVVTTDPAKKEVPEESFEERNARMEIMIERARQRLRAQSALEQPAVISTDTQTATQSTAQSPLQNPSDIQMGEQTIAQQRIQNSSDIQTAEQTIAQQRIQNSSDIQTAEQTVAQQPPQNSFDSQIGEQDVAQAPLENSLDASKEAFESTRSAATTPQPSITVVEPPVSVPTENIASVETAAPTTEEANRAEIAELPKKEAVDESTAILAESSIPSGREPESVATLNALRLPASVRQSGREFNYVSGAPVAYDFGGGGMQVEASASQLGRIRYLAQIGAAEEYSEVKLGAGIYHTPANADRMTLMLNAGIEYGNFALEDDDVSTALSDTGWFVQAESRFVLNNRFELNAGLGYSSFFEGDPVLFGSGFYHINRKLDAMTRFEVGDNDSFGIGIRYFY